MTILDKLLQVDPAGTPITATAPSTNVLDMQQQRDMGIAGNIGMDMHWEILLGAAFTAAGAGTLTVQSQGSVDNATWTTLCQTDAIPKASLTLNQRIILPLGVQQPQSVGIPRYYRLNYVVATGPFTAGTIEADLVVSSGQMDNPPTYPSGFTANN